MPASASWQAALSRAPQGFIENTTLEGVATLQAYVPTRDGWNVGIAYSKAMIAAPIRRVFWTTALWVPMSLGPALAVWQWPQGWTWAWIVAAGTLGTCGHMLWTRALKLGEVSALTTISFMQLPLVALAGYFLFDEILDHYTVIGASIIFIANVYITHREARLARVR